MRITRRLEFDAGHRIAAHGSLCRHLHGHRYALEVTLVGDPVDTAGAADEAMLMDFSEVKAIAKRLIVDRWDHAFLVHRADAALVQFLETLPDHRTVVVDAPPTAEHLAAHAFALLAPAYAGRFGRALRLERVRLYETPNCWADATADDA
ncbi:MAG: 6-carboxytetrahydropterin synthase [Burkholderiales bacterium]|jgi:6-pyruvoyltetrahydropterin/6-carboxytetrahydropterin synthase|nr:6-carboxytetrahydropterin synthase [Burkholderiales bacterium]